EPELRRAMIQLNVSSRAEFETWLAKEKAHLATLSKEPLQETMEMEYYQRFSESGGHGRMSAVLGVRVPFMPATTDTSYVNAAAATRRLETQRRHVLELHAKALATVQDLELRLGTTRWVNGDEKWTATAKMVSRRRYQRALDNLEGLIIARMLELAKVNMAGTAYKLRKQIAKALQARSKPVETAITTYNAAAEAMSPAKPTLDWEQVVEFAFLADFDLLREAREDIRDETWALPAGRVAMDAHYKLLRADEGIGRLDVEIPRFVTHMVDEEAFLLREEARLRDEGKEGIAHQVRLLHMERARFTTLHMYRTDDYPNIGRIPKSGQNFRKFFEQKTQKMTVLRRKQFPQSQKAWEILKRPHKSQIEADFPDPTYIEVIIGPTCTDLSSSARNLDLGYTGGNEPQGTVFKDKETSQIGHARPPVIYG
ncbi:hypothetical protein B0H11DRAFT_1724157, partial [Mycena galericulata]